MKNNVSKGKERKRELYENSKYKTGDTYSNQRYMPFLMGLLLQICSLNWEKLAVHELLSGAI